MNKRRRYKAKKRRRLERLFAELMEWWMSGAWYTPRQVGVDMASGRDWTVKTQLPASAWRRLT